MDNQQVINWIREQQRGGYSQGQIYASLIQNGYSADQAREALNYASTPQVNVPQVNQQIQPQTQNFSQQKPRFQQQPAQNIQQSNGKFDSKNIISMVFFTIISFGIYPSVWFSRIMNAFDQNDPSLKTTKELNSLIRYLGIFLILVTVGFVIVSNMNLTPFLESLNLSGDVMVAIQLGILTQVYFFTLFFFLLGIYAISIAVSVMLKKNIESAYSVKISGIGMIFGAFYLQNKINGFNSVKR